MPDSNEFSLSIDTDWKKQAQEEKRKLVEEAAKKAAAPAAPAPVGSGETRGMAGKGRGKELPSASFTTLVNSIVTQVLYYLGDLQQGEGTMNLDMAKYQLDTLGVVEEKTKGNLTEAEQKLLDSAAYETRTRFIGAASQYVNF